MTTMKRLLIAISMFMIGIPVVSASDYPNINMHDNVMMFPDIGITITFNSQTEQPFRPVNIKKSQTSNENRLEIDYAHKKSDSNRTSDLLTVLIQHSKQGYHMREDIFMKVVDSHIEGMGAVPGAEYTDDKRKMANGTIIRHVWIAKSMFAIPISMDFIYANDDETVIIITYSRDITANKLRDEGPKAVVIK